jgi:hypothetical protein
MAGPRSARERRVPQGHLPGRVRRVAGRLVGALLQAHLRHHAVVHGAVLAEARPHGALLAQDQGRGGRRHAAQLVQARGQSQRPQEHRQSDGQRGGSAPRCHEYPHAGTHLHLHRHVTSLCAKTAPVLMAILAAYAYSMECAAASKRDAEECRAPCIFSQYFNVCTNQILVHVQRARAPQIEGPNSHVHVHPTFSLFWVSQALRWALADCEQRPRPLERGGDAVGTRAPGGQHRRADGASGAQVHVLHWRSQA